MSSLSSYVSMFSSCYTDTHSVSEAENIKYDTVACTDYRTASLRTFDLSAYLHTRTTDGRERMRCVCVRAPPHACVDAVHRCDH